VSISGRDSAIEVTTDENGAYTVELSLEESELDAFVSITAMGTAEQESAGLISLLGTANELSSKAGEDSILTEDEAFSVNVTNITTAQYALAKIANDGENITTDEQLSTLVASLNYDEVITLATAIKVAIDKAGLNADLALPDGITDTLALVENTEATADYIQEVKNTPEFDEAQQEIYQDSKLVDTSSSYNVPPVYYVESHGTAYRFNQDGTGSKGELSYTWTETDGVIFAKINEDNEPFISFENRDNIDGQIEVHYLDESYSIKRLSTGEHSDVLLMTTTQLTRYPNGELPDESNSSSSTFNAFRDTAMVDITQSGAGIAYLPVIVDEPNASVVISSEKFVLNADGTGHATFFGFDFPWEIKDGALEIGTGSEGDEVYSLRYKQLSSSTGANTFAFEFLVNGEVDVNDDVVGRGTIVTEKMNFDAASVAGIYTYSSDLFTDPSNHFWFELYENGDADTKSTSDWDGDGVIEFSTMPGTWQVNSDGTITITRVRHQGGGWSSECRLVSTEGCELFHERTWELIGKDGSQFDLFHKHDYKTFEYTNYDTRTLYKVDSAPIMEPTANKVSVKNQNITLKKQFSATEGFKSL